MVRGDVEKVYLGRFYFFYQRRKKIYKSEDDWLRTGLRVRGEWDKYVIKEEGYEEECNINILEQYWVSSLGWWYYFEVELFN